MEVEVSSHEDEGEDDELLDRNKFLRRIKKRPVVESVRKSGGAIDAVRHDVVASAWKLHAYWSRHGIPPPISNRRGQRLSEI